MCPGNTRSAGKGIPAEPLKAIAMSGELWCKPRGSGPHQPETVLLHDLLLSHQQPRRDEEGDCRGHSSNAADCLFDHPRRFIANRAPTTSIAFIWSEPKTVWSPGSTEWVTSSIWSQNFARNQLSCSNHEVVLGRTERKAISQ